MLPVAAITIGLMLLVTVGLIVWDIIVATNNVPNSIDTISGRMKIWGKKSLILPWAWAMLYGHFWGPLRSGQVLSAKTGVPILILVSWGVFLLSVYLHKQGITISSWLMFFLILNIGALAGAFLWPQ